jgi:hypothetical protein
MIVCCKDGRRMTADSKIEQATTDSPAIPESAFPILDDKKPERATAGLMASLFTGHIKTTDPSVFPVSLALVRIVDGVCLDYTLARQAYYQLYQDERLGHSLSISSVLLQMYHHMENCLTNLKRVRELADVLRRQRPIAGVGQLVDKSDWKDATTHEQAIAAFRNAIQHHHNDLLEGRHNKAAFSYDPAGHLTFGPHALVLYNLAETIESYRLIALKVSSALHGPPI